MKKLINLILITVLLEGVISIDENNKTLEWGYRNEVLSKNNLLPKKWHKNHPKCYGHSQSPINVNFAQTVFDANLQEIAIQRLHGEPEQELWTMKNNGHTVKLVSNKKFKLEMEDQLFEFQQMHFHWRGSEHKVNGQNFAGELHLVHKSLNDSHTHAVIGFLFQLQDNDNWQLEPIIDGLKHIREHNSILDNVSMQLSHIVPLRINNYYRYYGSLTTPGCDEVVEWILTDKPLIGISEFQLLEFQSLKDKTGHFILSNSRPTQNLNGRTVRRSFYPMSQSESKNKRLMESASGFDKSNGCQKTQSLTIILAAILLGKIFA